MTRINISFTKHGFIVLAYCCFFLTASKAQTILSEIIKEQPSNIDSIYTLNYGWHSVYRGNSIFVGIQDSHLDWVGENLIDGAICNYEKQPDGSWTETYIYPQNCVKWFQPVFNDTHCVKMFFGWSFDANNELLVVGAHGFHQEFGPLAGVSGGAVFTFEKDKNGAWLETDILIDTAENPVYSFGRKVVLVDKHLFVYSEFLNAQNVRKGNVTVYERVDKGWKLVQRIKPHIDAESHKNFGLNMAANENYLVINSDKVDTHVSPSYRYNSLWFYEKPSVSNQWVFKQLLIDTTTSSGEFIQYNFYNDELYEARAYDNGISSGLTPLEREGAIYMYQKSAIGDWELNQIIKANRRYPHYFGHRFYKHSKRLFVSATSHEYDENNSNKRKGAGALFVFEREQSGDWKELSKIVAPDRDTSQFFGILSGYENGIVITSPGRTRKESLNEPPWYIQYYSPNTFYLLNYDTIAGFEDFKIFPNPTSNQIIVELDAFVSQATVQLINIQGQVLVEQKMFNSKTLILQLQTFPNSIYIVRVVQPNHASSKKVLKL